MSAAAPRQPEIDDRVHVWIHGQGCHPGTVEERIVDAPTGGNVVALQIKTDERVNDCPYRISRDYDSEMQASGSWHWPHDHQPPKQPSLNIEALARLDLRPDEILAVTYGIPGITVDQCEQVQEWLTCWLADHGQPVAGVLVLPQGSSLAAVRAPKDDAPSGTLPDSWGGLNRAEIREALESASAIKHLRGGYGL
jgi:hypothetical protein